MPYLERGPKQIVANLLVDEWDHPDVVAARSWSTGEHFDAPAWIHTGDYTFDNTNPQITATSFREPSDTPSGYDAIDPTGGQPVEWVDGEVRVDVWVREGEDNTTQYTGGINPKLYAEDLARRVQAVVQANSGGTTYNGEPELHRLGTGSTREAPTEDDTDVEHRIRIPVLYGWDRRL